MSNYNITKEQIKSISSIKIDLNNFSYTVLDCTFVPITESETKYPSIKLTLVKTTKFKEIMNDEGLIRAVDPELIKEVIINLQSTEPEHQIFFHQNVTNLSNAFSKIINILKQE